MIQKDTTCYNKSIISNIIIQGLVILRNNSYIYIIEFDNLDVKKKQFS